MKEESIRGFSRTTYKSPLFISIMTENEGIKTGEIVKEESQISSKQQQVHDILMSREVSWQEIIYDLINTEQLDPWDIDLMILSDGYLAKVQKLEEMDFFVSSKVLLAAAFLLRLKSEILLNRYIKSIDEILFGRKEDKKYVMERIYLDEEIPELVPKSPMPRFKKVTLQELISALDKAIVTENRRIVKEIVDKNAVREAGISLPKRTINVKDKIREIYDKIFGHLNPKTMPEKDKVSFTEIVGMNKEERIVAFLPLLHLDNQKRIWLEQNEHFDEIHIWLKKNFDEKNPEYFTDLGDIIEEDFDESFAEQENEEEEVNSKGKEKSILEDSSDEEETFLEK